MDAGRKTATGTSRREQLAELLRQQAAAPDTFALSYAQQRLWFLSQLQPAIPVYNVPLGYRIRGPLDHAALTRALSDVIARHEILRTVFPCPGGAPRQRVVPAHMIQIPVRDLSAGPDPESAAARIAASESRAPFDLATGPLLRPLLLRLGPDHHQLCLTIHHICFDGWSADILGCELSDLYAAGITGHDAQLPSLPIQYADFAEWQLQHVNSLGQGDSAAYWTARLGGISVLSTLPADHPRPAIQDFAGASITVTVPGDAAARLERLGRDHGITPFVVYLTAFALLVSAHTGGDDVVAGVPVSGRNRQELQNLIGFFTNTLVLRLDLSGDPAFLDLAHRVRAEVHAAMAHQDYPFERLVEHLHPERDLTRNPLFQVMFSYREDDSDVLQLPGCQVHAVHGDTATAKFDLTFSLTRSATTMSVRVEYSTTLFEPETVRRIADRYLTVLAEAACYPQARARELNVLPERERALLLTGRHGPAACYDRDVLAHHLIEQQVTRTPDAPAVLAAETAPDPRAIAAGTLTFHELNERANLLAARLRAVGVTPGAIVGVCVRRSPMLVVALLAILKADAAYLPLDPAYPVARLAFMIKDSRSATVIADQPGAALFAGLRLQMVDPSTSAPVVPPPAADGASDPVSRSARPDDLAYVIYTSGSTGRPKGVMVTHRNVVSFFAGMDAVAAQESPQTLLAVTSVSFDISVVELLWALARGHRVAVRAQEPEERNRGVPAPRRSASATCELEFSLFYFGSDDPERAVARYRLLLAGARFADSNGFTAIWTPERHFHAFGGRFPSPSVLGAALAAITERVHIRAGSVVLPLHDPIRVAEEWSVVDNLAGGRVGVSFASGWHANDFVLAPGDYAGRRDHMVRKIEQVRRLWRGGSLRRHTGTGNEIDVRIFPTPVQRELPVWVTSARSPDTFRLAGELGAGLLTHMIGHSMEQLAEKIAIYRRAWRENNHGPGNGHVTLMLHTFLGEDLSDVREKVRRPLIEYLKTSLDLIAGLSRSLGREVDFSSLCEGELDELAAQAFDRFFESAGLLGTPESCLPTLVKLSDIDVDEVACLIDFGVAEDDVIAALPSLGRLRSLSRERNQARNSWQPIAEQIGNHRVTMLQCTPSLAATLVDDDQARVALRGIQRLFVGGEALTPALASDLVSLAGGAVHNMYGPTEATIWATSHRISPGARTVPIGKPMANVCAYVVDRSMRLVPLGVPGELLLGGDGIAAGYFERPDLTTERFITDPFRPDGRLYRTGDLVRWLPSGDLEYLGRLDDQIKLRGHRIELGEIESVLEEHESISKAVAAGSGDGAGRYIAAYCVPSMGSSDIPSPGDLQGYLAQRLPGYMIPSAFVRVHQLPLTPNGKVDKAALPAPSILQAGQRPQFRAPENELQQEIAAIWQKLLGTDRVGLDDNFFQIGGNSLLIAQLRTLLHEKTGSSLSLVDMFRYPTVSMLAAVISGTGQQEPDRQAGRTQQRRQAQERLGQLRRERRAT